ncbi:MAG: 2-dehydropantoate 2-reductase [Ignavibacteriales bacterium]|nr:2-dehydropantoate 2-reductase [Ignavibacteriales bacterium]
MKIGIIGTGGVGGYFGGKIAKAGYDVTFVTRGLNLNVLKTNGLIVKSIQGDFKISRVNATEKIEDLKHSDLILICVKAWQVKEVALKLKSVIKENAVVIPLQNGILAVDELKIYLNEVNIVGGLCFIISKMESPGIINHFGVEPSIVFGEINNLKTERLNNIKEVFDKSGIKSKISEDIKADLWKKFITICVSGLLAVTKSTYGELRELPETRRMMIDLLQEIYMLSQKIGVDIKSDFVDNIVTLIDTYPYDSTSSLTRDIWEGKPSEINYQNGTVVKLGQRYGIETTINKFVYSCILPMELKARISGNMK